MSKHQTKVYLKPIGGFNFLIWFSQHVSFCPVLSYQLTNTQSTFQLALCALHGMLIYYTMPFFSPGCSKLSLCLIIFCCCHMYIGQKKRLEKTFFFPLKSSTRWEFIQSIEFCLRE